MRTAKEIINKSPSASIIIYGDEQQEAYNRIKLFSWLAGDVDWESLLQPLVTPQEYDYGKII